MVRRSTLVYELLKAERRNDDGFTPKEIMDRVSQAHEITAGKGLRKQVAAALRRGIDFGIIAKKNNKYRFDPGSSAVIEAWTPRKSHLAATNASVKNANSRRKKKSRRKPKTSAAGQSTSANKQEKRAKPSTRRPSAPLPPRPKVPKPPNWNPKRRNLSEEPIPKVIKHPSNNSESH